MGSGPLHMKKHFVKCLYVIAIIAAPVMAQDKIDGFEARVYRNASGQTMPYRLFVPNSYDSGKQYPLVLWLHGAGGAGNDNLRQISGDKVAGTRLWTKPATQSRTPAY